MTGEVDHGVSRLVYKGGSKRIPETRLSDILDSDALSRASMPQALDAT